jgi:hypothetical protein
VPRTLIHTSAWRRISALQGWRILKWAISILSAWYLYHIFSGAQFHHLLLTLPLVLSTKSGILLLAVTFCLMTCNWGFEAYKWTLLVRKFQPISFFNSIKAVLAGTTVSLWVPNRSGEYLGRVLFVKPENRIKGVLATLVGSLGQLVVTLVLGIIGLLIYTRPILPYLLWLGELALGLLCMLLILVAYFNLPRVRKLLPKTRWAKSFRKYMALYKRYHSQDLAVMLVLSFTRYAIFTTQFYLLLKVFGIDLPLIYAAPTIVLMFFIQTVIPSNGISELSLRGLVTALFIPYTANLLGVAAATYSLWFINLLAPGLAGLFMLLLARSKQKAQ